MDKFLLQNSQYSFPYHYIPYISPDGTPSRMRYMGWGLEYLCYQLHIKILIESMNPGSVLEVGCGDGYFIGLLDKGISRRKGIDLSREAIDFAKAFHPQVAFDCIPVGDCKEQYDVVVAIEVLEHIPDAEVPGFLRETCARVRPGGSLVLSVPTTVLPLHKKHYRHYDLPLLEKHMAGAAAGMALEKAEYVYKESLYWKLYTRFSNNRFWTVEFHPLIRAVWSRIWNVNRFASEKDGHHLISVYRKPAGPG